MHGTWTLDLLAAQPQAPAGIAVHNEDQLAQQRLQEPQLRLLYGLQAVLNSNHGCLAVELADGSLQDRQAEKLRQTGSPST